MKEMLYTALVLLVLGYGSSAMAHDDADVRVPGPCPGASCVPHSAQFNDWWCGSFQDETSCLGNNTDKVNNVACKWATNVCKPEMK